MGKEGNQGASGITRPPIFLDTLGPKITVVARVQQCLRVLLFGLLELSLEGHLQERLKYYS